MLQKLSELWNSWTTKGIHLPFAYDPETNTPSVTLGFLWLTSTLSIISLIVLHLNKVTVTATLVSGLFVLLSFIMYRLRKLDKVKIDLDDQSVELDNNDDSENKEKE